MSTRLSRLELLATAILLIGTTQALANYTVIDLDGTYGESYANGINNDGQVVGGFVSIPGGIGGIQATLWDGNTMTFLDRLGGSATAYAINNLEQVVGSAYTTDQALHAVLWNGTTATDLGALLGRGDSLAVAINDSGQIAGYSYNNPDYGGFRAVRWNGTTVIDLGTAGLDHSLAHGINNAGQVVGVAYNEANTVAKAMLWNGTAAIELDAQGGDAWAYAINDAGQVVGVSACKGCDTEYYATIWDGNTMTKLDSLGVSSRALAINDSGHVVGNAQFAEGGSSAFLWNGTTMLDLNDVLNNADGIVLQNAKGINNSGWIVAEGYHSSFRGSHAFLLIPAIDEPESYAMLLAGLGLLSWRMRRSGCRLKND